MGACYMAQMLSFDMFYELPQDCHNCALHDVCPLFYAVRCCQFTCGMQQVTNVPCHMLQVLSVYLFHELPPEVRREAAKEFARVLKPGGLLILTDSVQLGDRSHMDKNLGLFGDFNEPFYRTFIAEDFGKMFMDVGCS